MLRNATLDFATFTAIVAGAFFVRNAAVLIGLSTIALFALVGV